MNFEELKRRLLALDTACVCDGNKAGRAADPTVTELRVIDQGYPCSTQVSIRIIIVILYRGTFLFWIPLGQKYYL